MQSFWDGFEKRAVSLNKERRLMDEMSPSQRKQYESMIAVPEGRPLEGIKRNFWSDTFSYRRSPKSKSYLKDFRKGLKEKKKLGK